MDNIKLYIDNFLQKSRLQEQLTHNRRYFTLWCEVVGKNIARHALPIYIKKNKLFVEVSDSTWVFHLTMLKSKIIKDFNTAAGSDIINDLKFLNVDFHSRNRGQRARRNVPGKETFYLKNENITIAPDEEEKIKKAVSLSPRDYQLRLYNLLKKSCLYQKERKDDFVL
ncbi:MAG: DUF721 domain-containing protein [Firmicutes bacterium]|nr:DUF721 domain-containing protein [Bacillota bacterium]